MELSIAATQHHWQTRLQYSYWKRDRDQRRDVQGHVTSEDTRVSKTILVNSVPFEQLVERNGHPLSIEEEQNQKEKLDRLSRETTEQHAERLRKQDEDSASLVREVPKAFDFQLLGEEAVNGRPSYVLRATPHSGYHPQGKYGKMFSMVEGRLWIDKEDLGWAKADVMVIQPFSMGLFLARLLPGSHITLEQTRVDDGVWMPERIEVQASAKILFVKSLMIDRVLTYSEYRATETAARTARRIGDVAPLLTKPSALAPAMTKLSR